MARARLSASWTFPVFGTFRPVVLAAIIAKSPSLQREAASACRGLANLPCSFGVIGSGTGKTLPRGACRQRPSRACNRQLFIIRSNRFPAAAISRSKATAISQLHAASSQQPGSSWRAHSFVPRCQSVKIARIDGSLEAPRIPRYDHREFFAANWVLDFSLNGRLRLSSRNESSSRRLSCEESLCDSGRGSRLGLCSIPPSLCRSALVRRERCVRGSFGLFSGCHKRPKSARKNPCSRDFVPCKRDKHSLLPGLGNLQVSSGFCASLSPVFGRGRLETRKYPARRESGRPNRPSETAARNCRRRADSG